MATATAEAASQARRTVPGFLNRMTFFMSFLSEWVDLSCGRDTDDRRLFPRVGQALRRAWERLPAESGEPEAVAGPRHELVSEPGRPLGLGCDHDLVGREGRQCIRDCQQRIGVADTTFGVNPALFQPADDCGGPLLRSAAGGILIRQPMPEPGVR